MFKSAKPFFLIVESPLHAGSGSELGVIDLPIQRERHTDFPKIEGSSLKGAIREVFEEYLNLVEVSATEKEYQIIVSSVFAEDRFKNHKNDMDKLKAAWKTVKKKEKINNQEKEVSYKYIRFQEAISTAFGPDDSGDRAAALSISDARLLLFPVKSMKGVYALITCPMVLKRFQEDLKLCGIEDKNCFPLPAENTIADGGFLSVQNKIILEEYTFGVTPASTTKTLAEWLSQKTGIDDIKQRLVVLPDNDFRDFVNLFTEVITRNKINNETGTVESGALFTEEYLPTESMMYSLCLASLTRQDENFKAEIFEKDSNGKYLFGENKQEEAILKFFCKFLPVVMQAGGNATIGKGLISTKTWGE